ncbi:HupE/UreJ family protein [Paenibacillus urinalis]|uniref:HupE/UreJ family protein n=1 Tax=Paenibacillus urinalis TaxID=521520 RepID=A0ABY7XBJ2_9BACL|nr:HupE/UreJ family protein [Paenibacillus urinalis]WDH99442.1 HupE/UreJ family protein [Paenibacillus urinalis]WDI03076.1 HupE/UreJ family protein [Paenibacillus urinalis]
MQLYGQCGRTEEESGASSLRRSLPCIDLRGYTKWLAALILFVMTSSIFAQPASAHMNTLGYSNIQVEQGGLIYEIELDLQEVAQWMDVRSGGVFILGGGNQPPEGEVAWTQDELRSLIEESLIVEGEGQAAELATIDDIRIVERNDTGYLHMLLGYDFAEAADDYSINYNFFFDMDANHQNFAAIRMGEASKDIVFTNGQQVAAGEITAEGSSSTTVELPGWAVTAWNYLVIGVQHIWFGIDHLLFILALVLAKLRPWDYVKVLTAFTVGHSLTIALAALDIVRLPSSFVEPFIALSIAYVAVENIFRKQVNRRWLIALLFGLIHGFGFAQVLQESPVDSIVLALISFNVGVEIGQLSVLAVVIPLLLWLRRFKKVYTYSNAVISGGIMLFGLFWFVIRVI